MRKKWKIALGAVFGVVVLSNLIFQTLKPLEVSLMKVEAEDISKKLTEEGIVLAEEEKYISSIYGGKITGINVREGDKVKKGDILITFDTQEIGLSDPKPARGTSEHPGAEGSPGVNGRSGD